MSELAKLLSSGSRFANRANSANQPGELTRISSFSSDEVGTTQDPEHTDSSFHANRVASLAEKRRERRRQDILEMLAEAPAEQRCCWRAYDKDHPDYVILALAIRGVGTFELSISRDRYDVFKLADILGQRVK